MSELHYIINQLYDPLTVKQLVAPWAQGHTHHDVSSRTSNPTNPGSQALLPFTETVFTIFQCHTALSTTSGLLAIRKNIRIEMKLLDSISLSYHRYPLAMFHKSIGVSTAGSCSQQKRWQNIEPELTGKTSLELSRTLWLPCGHLWRH